MAQSDTGDVFGRVRAKEADLDIYGARDALVAGLGAEPEQAGLREYAAWFFYRHGFHDRRCLELFESVQAGSGNADATTAAVAHLRHALGLPGGVPWPPAEHPQTAPAPGDLPARLQYARELFWSGSAAQARTELEALIAAKPGEPVLRVELAKVLSAMGDRTGARRELDTAETLRPGEKSIAATLATLPPVAALTRGQATQHSAADKALRAAQAAAAQLDQFGAREQLRIALAADPSQPGLREYAAWFFFLNGFLDYECLALLEEAQASASDPAAMAAVTAMVRQKLGLERPTPQPRAPRPRSRPPAGDLPGRLQYARELLWSGSPSEARTELEALVAAKPQEPALRLELARVLIADNDYRAAARELAAADRLRPHTPEIALERAKAEALRGRRTAALRALRGTEFPDQGPLHLVKAQAHHYAGECPQAAREYRMALETRPHDEIAAHGLAEAALYNNAVPEAREMISSWSGSALQCNWDSRVSLEREVAAPRLRGGGSLFSNSLDYRNWNAGGDFRFRPIDALELGVSAIHGWYAQDGYASISRQTGNFWLNYQPGDAWSVSGRVGLNGYSTGWTSVTGGFGVAVRPFPTLRLSVDADHMDVVDAEPPMGIALYGMAATIGGAAGRATMNALTFSALWNPLERLEFFGKYRLGELTGDNMLNDYYVSAAYRILRNPHLLVGYGVSQTRFSRTAPVYTEGFNSTSYYYDPADLVMQNFYAEFGQDIGRHFSWGAEGHFYQQPVSSGVGTGIFGYLKLKWGGNQSLRIDARWYSQDRGLNRDGTASGSYSALNLVAMYEFRF